MVDSLRDFISRATNSSDGVAEQVSEAIIGLSDVIDQNAEAARSAGESSASLSGDAEALRYVIGHFTLDAPSLGPRAIPAASDGAREAA